MSAAQSEIARFYEAVARMRAVELIQNDLWQRGHISGEMHTGIGEEGIVAGVLAGLEPHDAIACDHRPTSAFVGRGVHAEKLLLECMGMADGLGAGCGGHMHLLSRDHLLTSDGIVGSSGPQACGFALAARQLRPGSVAVAFFGEGATNQGMMMEAYNLAVVWRLPVLFVCKDNGWSITTRSKQVTAGEPSTRAAAFGLNVSECGGTDVLAVAAAAAPLIRAAREKHQAGFLRATCVRPEGHFLGDPLLRVFADTRAQLREVGVPLMQATGRSGGGGVAKRLTAVADLGARFATLGLDKLLPHDRDPVRHARRKLGNRAAGDIDSRIQAELGPVAERLLARARGSA